MREALDWLAIILVSILLLAVFGGIGWLLATNSTVRNTFGLVGGICLLGWALGRVGDVMNRRFKGYWEA